MENIPEMKRLINQISLLRIPTHLERTANGVVDKNRDQRNRLVISLEKTLKIYGR